MRIEELLGFAVVHKWAELPRDIQEMLFETAVAAHPEAREQLAIELHNRHPRTQHPVV